MTAAIVQFHKKQEAKFLCSACGADRACDCNAPAVAKLAEIKEKNRIAARESMRRKRQQNQSSVNVNTDPIDEPCDDCESPQEFWQRSVANMAGDAISLESYWSRQFGEWRKFEITSELVTLAKQAAEAWNQLAGSFEKMKDNSK